MLKLALHGPRLGGKSYLARALKERGFQVLDYSRFLKELLVAFLDLLGFTVTVEEIEANKEAWRTLLIDFAHHIGFDDGMGVEALIDQIDPAATGVVFDNVRFPAQWKLLQDNGFTLLRITTPFNVRRARAYGKGITKDRFVALGIEEPSEQPLPEQPGEMHLSVNGDIQNVLDELAATLIERWIGTPALEIKTTEPKAKAKAKITARRGK